MTVLYMMCSYLYTDFLYLYFFKNILGLKYSMKSAVLGFLGLWVAGCFGKIFPQYILGMEVIGVTSILLLVLNYIYAIVCYSSSIKKRILVVTIYTIVQAIMDMLGLRITGMITGIHELTMSDERFVATALLCSGMTITLGTVVAVRLWKMIEQKQWKYEKYQWTCIILPISQYLVLQSIAMKYSFNAEPLPLIVILGFVLGIVTDIYMFFLLNRLNDRKQTESELKRMNYQYELEQVRYEQLKASQEETAKMRHDFQNYILTLKQME